MKKILASAVIAAASYFGTGVAPAQAQDMWLGQIVMGGWNFCPRTTLPAAGQLLPISSNSALFSLLGCTYGGDCRTTFALPDLRGRAPIGVGQGLGLSSYPLGAQVGQEQVTLNVTQMPSHSHVITNQVTAQLNGSDGAVNSATINGSALANQAAPHYAGRGAIDQAFEAGSVAVSVTSTAQNNGGNLSHENRGPRLTLQYCVVTQGIFPSRS